VSGKVLEIKAASTDITNSGNFILLKGDKGELIATLVTAQVVAVIAQA